MATDIFDEIANSSPSTSGYPYISGKDSPLGNYLLDVQVFKRKIGAVDKAEKFIGELKVVESDIPDRGAGSVVQFVMNPTKAKFPQMVLGELKQFVAAVAKCHVNEVTAQDIRDAVGEQNPFKGLKVRARVYEKKSGFRAVEFTAA